MAAKAVKKKGAKIVCAGKKATGVVDTHVPNASKYELVSDEKETYNRHLMKSNVERNNNKYYIAQLLEETSGKS